LKGSLLVLGQTQSHGHELNGIILIPLCHLGN